MGKSSLKGRYLEAGILLHVAPLVIAQKLGCVRPVNPGMLCLLVRLKLFRGSSLVRGLSSRVRQIVSWRGTMTLSTRLLTEAEPSGVGDVPPPKSDSMSSSSSAS